MKHPVMAKNHPGNPGRQPEESCTGLCEQYRERSVGFRFTSYGYRLLQPRKWLIKIAVACAMAIRPEASHCDSDSLFGQNLKEDVMLRWALGFFVVALVAALLGFSGIAIAAAGIAKILFFVFLVLFIVTLAGHLLNRA
jgi:uncharacterized membrane protein YtjA (UPF0391 family)